MASTAVMDNSADSSPRQNQLLFWGCFAALIATAFGFQVRAMLMETWGSEFGIDKTQQGEIFGAGLWPFAISIIIFSLIIDRIGYGRAMIFAGICHIGQAVMLYSAKGEGAYNMLYWGSIVGALGNGTVEAVINPVVATLFPRQKTKWLAILHAGWPGGLVIAGLLFMGVANTNEAGNITNYSLIILLTLLPIVVYTVMLFGRKFPVQERVQAGVSFKEMLQEPGILSWAVAVVLVVLEVGRVFEFSTTIKLGAMAVLIIPFAAYVRKLGRPIFFLMVLIMCPLATTELGTDSWITPLMTNEMTIAGVNPAWLLVYTSLIMMVLRFFAGPIVHALPPLKLLAISAALAAVGLYSLGSVSGFTMIFAVATLYGFGKTFFWPATLGVISEQFPKSGALGINMIAGIGMLSVGTLGAAWLGYVQDVDTVKNLQADHAAIHEKTVANTETKSFLGLIAYQSVDDTDATDEEKKIIGDIQDGSKKQVLKTATMLPIAMCISYVLLMMYFTSQGGYKVVELSGGQQANASSPDTTSNEDQG
ncbi:MAG: MFS transporter [Fuerstiella sp.]|nr:MFS transporter [Fuerstiella sp.]